MKTSAALLAIVTILVAAAGGYWLGAGTQTAPIGASTADMRPAAAQRAEEPVRKVLYYRNPMGLADTSPTPKKDPMGMNYVPVYEGEAETAPQAANQIRIGTDKVQKLGVRSEPAVLRPLDRTVRVAGRVEADERRTYAISPKFEGYVERLLVNVTGQPVTRGQPLFEVYSPELVSAQREYTIAMQGVQAMAGAGSDALGGMKQLAESSLARLRNWDLPPDQIAALVDTGEARRTLTFRSPVSGIITEKKALQGMRFMPGEALYQVTDLSSVWVVADVFEQDIAEMKTGAKAKVTLNAYPNRVFGGTITYVYPMLKADTRTLAVRVELPNPGQLLKPAMFAQVEIPIGSAAPVLTIPDSAVIDSGTRRIVLVQVGEGRFEPREVKIGARSGSYVEVQEGVREGEQVVVAANFLIDAESNLKAAIDGLRAHPGHETATAVTARSRARVGHRAQGRVEGVDLKRGTITLRNGPVASLKWPAMTMEFKVANLTLLQGLKPGADIAVEFVERQPEEWVITATAPPQAAPVGATPAARGHTGH